MIPSNRGPDNFTGPFHFEVTYEIDISEQLVGWLKELPTDDARREMVEEHLNAKTEHVNVRDARSEWDDDDELLLDVMGERADAW